LKTRPPKYQKAGKYAVIYIHGKRIYLGSYGSPESQKEYARIIAESQSNPAFLLPKCEKGITFDEVAAAYLDNAKERFSYSYTEYQNYKTALTFALDIYGHQAVDEFSPLKLKPFETKWCGAVDFVAASSIITLDEFSQLFVGASKTNLSNPVPNSGSVPSNHYPKERPVHSTTRSIETFPTRTKSFHWASPNKR